MSSPAPSEDTAPSKRNVEQSLKRGRAESVEPSQPDQTTLESIASKKNRVASGAPSTSQLPSKPLDPDTNASPNLDASATTVAPAAKGDSEGKNVGEVRRKVAEMSYAEQAEKAEKAEQEGGVELEVPEKKDDQPGSAMSLSTNPDSTIPEDVSKSNSTEATEATESEDNGERKRKSLERTESSLAAETEAKRARDENEAQKKEQAQAERAKVAPKKTQATFGSFASSASPFAARAGASPFATAAGASANAGTAGSAGGSPAPAAAGAGAGAAAGAGVTAGGPRVAGSGSSTPAKPSPSPFAGSGFGNYSSSFSAFAKKTPVLPEVKKDGESSTAGAGGSSFGDILKAEGGNAGNDDEDKVQMTEQDLHTGEEEEETVYQTRSKLYVMEADGGWRERGVGTLKLNVRRSDGKAPRIVMRAEGVLRLILNVSLYVGMACLEDGKHVRLTVFESGEKRFVTLRTGSGKAAAELAGIITEHIPLESSVPPPSKSPEPSTEPSITSPAAPSAVPSSAPPAEKVEAEGVSPKGGVETGDSAKPAEAGAEAEADVEAQGAGETA